MPELRTLVRVDGKCLAVAAALIAAVVAIGLLVGWRPATAADDEVLEEMVAHRSSGVTSVMNFITDIFSPAGTLALGLVIAALLAWRRSPAAAVFVLGSTAAASAVTLVLKSLFARQRPPVIDHLANETDYGFPSGHVTGTTALLVSATIALTVGWSARRILLALIVPAAVVGTVAASRLYLGVHWFSDTAAGAAVGLAGIALALAVLPPDQWRRSDAWLAAAVSRTRVPRTPLGRPASR